MVMKKKERKVMRLSVEGIEVIVSIAVIKMMVKKEEQLTKTMSLNAYFKVLLRP
jgi:hypothetical protein